MKKRADRAIKDNELGGEGWAQMASRPNKSFPEAVKEFLREQFLKGEESASEKVRLHHTYTAGMAVSMCVTLQRSAREVSAYACWETSQISGMFQHSCQLLI